MKLRQIVAVENQVSFLSFHVTYKSPLFYRAKNSLPKTLLLCTYLHSLVFQKTVQKGYWSRRSLQIFFRLLILFSCVAQCNVIIFWMLFL